MIFLTLHTNTCACTHAHTCIQGDPMATFNRTLICQYCYQLPDANLCCSPNTSCNVRGSPPSTFLANCTANSDVFCIREYQDCVILGCGYLLHALGVVVDEWCVKWVWFSDVSMAMLRDVMDGVLIIS